MYKILLRCIFGCLLCPLLSQAQESNARAWSLIGLDKAALAVLAGMTGVDLASAGIVTALRAGPAPAPADIALLSALIGQMVPLKILVAGAAFSVSDLTFLRANPTVFGITDFNLLG